MKKPEACGDLSEIRSAIDRIDMQLIDLISARAGYVKAAAKFKADTGAVKAPERVRKMLEEEIAPAAQQHARSVLTKMQEDALATLKQEGVTIVTMTDAERVIARERLAPVWAKWEPEIGKEYIDLARSMSK